MSSLNSPKDFYLEVKARDKLDNRRNIIVIWASTAVLITVLLLNLKLLGFGFQVNTWIVMTLFVAIALASTAFVIRVESEAKRNEKRF